MAKGLPRSLAHAVPGTEVFVKRYRYLVKNLTVTVTAGASTAKGFGTAVLGTFPQGNILLLGGVSYLQFRTADADAIAAWEGEYAIGTAATADATLTGTDGNIIALADIAAATAKLSPVTRGVCPADATQIEIYDNTASTINLNLNMTTDDDSITDSLVADFTVNGYVDLVYIVLGDD